MKDHAYNHQSYEYAGKQLFEHNGFKFEFWITAQTALATKTGVLLTFDAR